MFERALARSGLPVRRTEGFNPRPKITLPLPRSVGVAASDERLVVEFSKPVSAGEAQQLLASRLPEGVQLLDAVLLEDARACHPRAATYELRFSPNEAHRMQTAVDRFLAAASIPMPRVMPGAGRTRLFDVRPCVQRMECLPDRVRWTQDIHPDGTAKPAEVLEALGLNGRACLHRVERTQVAYGPK